MRGYTCERTHEYVHVCEGTHERNHERVLMRGG